MLVVTTVVLLLLPLPLLPWHVQRHLAAVEDGRHLEELHGCREGQLALWLRNENLRLPSKLAN